MRAMIAMGYGAIAGLVAGLVSALVLSVVVAIFGLVDEGVGTALAIFVLWAFFGGIVAAGIGTLIGAVAGVVLGLLKAEARAPLVAMMAGGGLALVASVVIVSETQTSSPASQVLVAASAITVVCVFAAVGYRAGTAFAKVTARVRRDYGPSAGSFPGSTPEPEQALGAGHSYVG